MFGQLRSVFRTVNVINRNTMMQSSNKFHSNVAKSQMLSKGPITVPARHMSETAEVVIENLVPEQKGFKSRALRDVATGRYKNLPISCKKLRFVCKMLSGLSVREAVNQLLISHNRKNVYIRRGLRTIADYAVNIFNMNRDRLVIDEITSGRGVEYKRLDIKGRGRASIKHRRHAHLTIKLKEQPYREGEVRIGRYGRTISTWKTVDKVANAWKQKQAEL